MTGFCPRCDVLLTFCAFSELKIDPARKAMVVQAVGTWEFSAHDFDSDELLFAALTMLEHALQMPELEKWRISTSK